MPQYVPILIGGQSGPKRRINRFFVFKNKVSVLHFQCSNDLNNYLLCKLLYTDWLLWIALRNVKLEQDNYFRESHCGVADGKKVVINLPNQIWIVKVSQA